ncbi:MAG: hypothetical protein O7D32_00760, partial [bacterium]|nr:hypothetical protein [bacterium]
KLIINPFQYRLVALHLLQFGAVVAIMLAALYIPLIMEFDRSGLSVHQKAALTNRFLELNSLLFPAMWILAGFVGAYSIVISHRIAGPIFRIRTVLQNLATGNLSGNLKLRDKDYLIKEAEVVNVLIDSLRKNVCDLDKTYEEACATLAQLNATMGDAPLEAKERLAELKDRLQDWKRQLERYSMTGEARRIHRDTEESEVPHEHSPLGI